MKNKTIPYGNDRKVLSLHRKLFTLSVFIGLSAGVLFSLLFGPAISFAFEIVHYKLISVYDYIDSITPVTQAVIASVGFCIVGVWLLRNKVTK